MVSYYLLILKKISLIITSIISFEDDDFAANEALNAVIIIKRAKRRVTKEFKLTKLTNDEGEKITIVYRII